MTSDSAFPTSLHERRSLRRVVVVAIFAGLLLRIGLAWISIGTDDARTWKLIGLEARKIGTIEAYRRYLEFNHPPIMVLYAMLITSNADPTGVATRDSALLMKLPAIAADLLSIWLLAKIWLGRGDARRAKLAAVAMALSPIAILISGYHCNTDNLFAYLSLLAVFLMTDRRAFFLGGLVLAGAINVKLIPVLLIPGMYSLCRSWRDALRLTAGLSIGVIPFLPLIMAAPEAVSKNMLQYAPLRSDWGIAMLLHDAYNNSPFAQAAQQMMNSYSTLGRYLILLCVAGLSLFNFIKRRWNGYEIATICFAILLVLAPGFGPQYTVMIVPLLLAISLTRSWIYGILGGIYLSMTYFSRLVSDGLPLRSAYLHDPPTPPGTTFGLLAWGALFETALMLILGWLKTEIRRRGLATDGAQIRRDEK